MLTVHHRRNIFTIYTHLLCKSLVIFLCPVGTYAPVTIDGNIMVDGVLASCYAYYDHDLSHFAIIPVQWFPGMMEFIFGWNYGIQGYTGIAESVGRYVVPNYYLHVTSDFDRK